MTSYIISYRDNIRQEILENFEPLMNENFKELGNNIEPTKFDDEEDVILYLENKYRIDMIKSKKKQPKFTQNVKRKINTTPNNVIGKIYGIYSYDKDTNEITYLYSYKKRGSKEAYMVINKKDNIKKYSSYQKYNINKFINFDINDFEFSSEPLEISGQYYEGIYPLNFSNNEMIEEYNNYVRELYDFSNSKIKNVNISLVTDKLLRKQHILIVSKLKKIEDLLKYIKKKNETIFKPKNNNKRDELIERVIRILKRQTKDDKLKTNILSMIMDPEFYNGEIYQIRFGNELISWNKNYSSILLEYSIMCSMKFTNIILDFNIKDIFNQYQTYENILAIYNNTKDYYNDTGIIIEKNKAKFKNISSSFN